MINSVSRAFLRDIHWIHAVAQLYMGHFFRTAASSLFSSPIQSAHDFMLLNEIEINEMNFRIDFNQQNTIFQIKSTNNFAFHIIKLIH